jgi:hypothetical protein
MVTRRVSFTAEPFYAFGVGSEATCIARYLLNLTNAELPKTYSEERSKAFFALWMRIASREGHCAECLPVGSKSSTVKPVDAQ